MRVGGGLPKARARGTISRERAEELVLVPEDEDVCIWMFVLRIGSWLAEEVIWALNCVPGCERKPRVSSRVKVPA